MSRSQSQPMSGVEACVFDAYGTLFDVNNAAARASERLGERWLALAELWRAKQLQYTWLRSLTGNYVDFWTVTGDALDFALTNLDLDQPGLREHLMGLYLELAAYPDVAETLANLKRAGLRLAILSNGAPAMLDGAVRSAGLVDTFEAVLSVDEVRIYKPHPSVYRLACNKLALAAERICFVSSNGWDAFSGKDFGFQVAWCNRFRQAVERIPQPPDIEIMSLAELPGALGVASPS